MNYVYDIMINFKKDYLDFFEWNKNDKVICIKKIPIFRIKDADLNNIVNNDFKINNDFLSKLVDKNKNKIMCLLFSESNVIAFQFNENGNCINRSSLMVDDELDILENYYNMKYTTLKYEIIKSKKNIFLTRNELHQINFLNNKVNKLTIPNDNTKIKYLYFECFGVMENDSFIALKEIKKSIKNKVNINNLYNFFKLIETNK